MKNSFSNHILISMPHMADPVFSKSIVLICNHSDDGAMGIIINKPIDRKESGLILVETELDALSLSLQYTMVAPLAVTLALLYIIISMLLMRVSIYLTDCLSHQAIRLLMI